MAEQTQKRTTKAQLQARLNQVEKQRDRVARLYENVMVQHATLLSRYSVARGLGQQYGGERDLYETLGYKLNPEFDDYLGFFERDGIATRIVKAVSDETWRKHPVLTENKNETPDEDNPSPLQSKFEDLADRLDLWARFNEVDEACGISRFGLIFLGLPGDPQDPYDKKGELLYVSVHDEGDATVDEFSIIRDPSNPRFGMPEYYNIIVDEQSEATMRVHYSRIIHVKEGKERGRFSRFYGVPRLKKSLNRLYDLEKVVGGGSEAFWLLIYRGLALAAKEGFTLPPKDSTERQELIDEATEFQNKIKRFMLLNGLEVQDLGGKPVDSWNQFRVLIAYIAGAERIPQRLLIGSEAGKLASTQDDANWSDFIDWRRENHAEPYILRPMLRRLAELGELEDRKRFFAYWPSLFELNDIEEADVAVKVATAANQASGGAPEMIIPPDEFAKRLPGKWKYTWTPDKLAEVAEESRPEPVPPQLDENPLELEEVESSSTGFSANVQKTFARVRGWFGGNGNRKAESLDLERIRSALKNNGNGEVNFAANRFISHFGPIVIHNENENSAMIALRIPDNLRDELQQQYPVMDDETHDNLHITLAFLGDSRTLDMKHVAWAVSDFVEAVKPIKTQLQGLARFVSGNEKDPIVATVDSPDFPDFRKSLTDALDKHGIPYHKEHGFIPHMTLAYIPKDDKMPLDTIEPLEMNFGDVYLVVGGQWIGFKLGEAWQGEGVEL